MMASEFDQAVNLLFYKFVFLLDSQDCSETEFHVISLYIDFFVETYPALCTKIDP